jgi:hypothetical protein
MLFWKQQMHTSNIENFLRDSWVCLNVNKNSILDLARLITLQNKSKAYTVCFNKESRPHALDNRELKINRPVILLASLVFKG